MGDAGAVGELAALCAKGKRQLSCTKTNYAQEWYPKTVSCTELKGRRKTDTFLQSFQLYYVFLPKWHLWMPLSLRLRPLSLELGPLSQCHDPAGFKRPIKNSLLPFYSLIKSLRYIAFELPLATGLAQWSRGKTSALLIQRLRDGVICLWNFFT